ncbi:protein GAMETE EXPRESSED 3-like [Quercus lobata]|uniref:protein GAMETE EXPRESSED 3-like n=1 Tax=Quercus lobata TaxID=97700 RepID=UPI0012442E06|nr:protein GAMETE EXPRESSED 3-like [Quercus lobata]
MPIIPLLILFLLFPTSLSMESQRYTGNPRLFSGQEPSRSSGHRLSKPLVGEDGRIYACSEKDLFAFESNGTIAWTIHLDYTCNAAMAPVQGGLGKIYLVAENRVLEINSFNIGSSKPAAEVFFGPVPGQEELIEIIGLSVSTLSSSVFINIKNRGLFAYTTRGQLLWSVGPVIYRSGYQLGCRKNVTDCYFTSVPVIDQCEASIYISNTEGELYSLSVRSPYFKWIQDFSSLDKYFTVSPGNNGRLYVTVPARALVLALDVSMGTVLWQRSIGPLSTTECAPVVDSNGWVSVGSLDGFLYSFSPTGILKKFSKADTLNCVIQVTPLLDCSGYAIYFSQTEMEGKISQTIDEYTYVSAMRPKTVIFTLLVPATGFTYWSERYPDQFSSSLSESDLRQFVLDEGILLAFVAASKTGNPLQCRTKRQKCASSCSQAKPKYLSIYTGNERAIILFLLFESAVLVMLAGLVRFCCIFWRKKKVQGQDLRSFLEKRVSLNPYIFAEITLDSGVREMSIASLAIYTRGRHIVLFTLRSLQLKKKVFDRTITELEQKAAEQAVANEVFEKLGDMVREREGIERKLSTTYSLGRDRAGSQSKSMLPVYDGKTRSYSFLGSKKESATVFHTLSDTSSEESGSEKDTHWGFHEEELAAKAKAKAKAPIEVESSSDDGIYETDYQSSPSETTSSSRGFINPLNGVQESGEVKLHDKEVKSMQTGSRLSLKRRRALSSTN